LAAYRFHAVLASLQIYDVPLGYAPPRTDSIFFAVTYNQREATQPQTFTYSHLGPRWTFNWLSFIQDDPTAVGQPVELYLRGGGRESYGGFQSGVSAYHVDTKARVRIVSTSPIVYEKIQPDGSIEIFSQSDGAAAAPRRVFLTGWKDSAGNTVTFTYDSQLRLVSVTDAIGQVTTLSYGLASDPENHQSY
jgi:YD repeat-containing protein